MLAIPKTWPQYWALGSERYCCERNANAEPRKMIPTSAKVRGKYRPTASAAKAGGKHVNSKTTQKMSQTWLVSHTGPIACAIASRC